MPPPVSFTVPAFHSFMHCVYLKSAPLGALLLSYTAEIIHITNQSDQSYQVTS